MSANKSFEPNPLRGSANSGVRLLRTVMDVRNTKQRQEVQEIYRWSVTQAGLGQLEQIPDWDTASTSHNSLFRDVATGKQWVVYLSDQAWPGEVRLVTTSPAAT